MRANQIIRLDFSKGKRTAKLLSTSCWHLGNPSASLEGIERFLVRAKKHAWIHHGDIVEGIMRRDRRHDIREHKDDMLAAMRLAKQKIAKAKRTCWGLLSGNHDATPSKEIGDVVEDIASEAGVPYLTGTFFTWVKCPDGVSDAFFAHGNKVPGSRIGEPERVHANKKIWLRNYLKGFSAYLKGVGHAHQSIVAEPIAEKSLGMKPLGEQGVHRPSDPTHGSWHYAAPSMFMVYDPMANYSNYAEMALYQATDLGWTETVYNRNATIGCIREVDSHGVVQKEHTQSTM